MAAHSITVRRHPFASPEGRRLVELLDADLASLYPDWDDFSHHDMHHENNPRPAAEDALDSKAPSPQLRKGAVRAAELRPPNTSLASDELTSSLVFCVAL